MKKLVFKLCSFVPFLVLTSCGYGLKEVYEGIPYNSTVFEENYFNSWDKTLDSTNDKYEVNKVEEERVLTDSDYVFTSFESDNFKAVEPEWNNYNYHIDVTEPEDGKLNYGPEVCLGSNDNTFKYGITSKLFDGRLFCGGLYQKSRVQVAPSVPENEKRGGFGIRFSKELTNGAPYFMANFKCSMVTENNYSLDSNRLSNITLKLGFYVKNNTGLTYIPVSYTVEDAPTNSGDAIGHPSRADMYVCFGFKLTEKTGDGLLNLDRLVGLSFEYELNSCDVTIPSGETPMHAIMLYEISFPHSTWH